MQPDQAANEPIEEQVLNFLVNTLDEEIDVELGENADIDSEDIGMSSSRTSTARNRLVSHDFTPSYTRRWKALSR